ncbi:hypothetical protein [Vibrio phage RYC]|nr:hypothetical protein [Vibrio phage RYC]
MYKIRKGSIILEYAYGIKIVSTITSEVKFLGNGRQSFTAVTKRGNPVEYVVGRGYGESIEVIKY